MGFTEWARDVRDVDTVFSAIWRRQIAPIFAVSVFPQVITKENVAIVVDRLHNELGIRYVDSLKEFAEGINLESDYSGEEFELMSCVKDGVLTEEFKTGSIILRDFFREAQMSKDNTGPATS